MTTSPAHRAEPSVPALRLPPPDSGARWQTYVVAVVAVAACVASAGCRPPKRPTDTPNTKAPRGTPSPVGRARDGRFACPAGRVQFAPPVSPPCRGRVYDWPAPRPCAAAEHSVCGLSFGTSEGGTIRACRKPDGKAYGPIEVVEADGSIVAQATCRDGNLTGALYRWRDGAISEVLPMRDGTLDGLYLRWDHGRLVEEMPFADGHPDGVGRFDGKVKVFEHGADVTNGAAAPSTAPRVAPPSIGQARGGGFTPGTGFDAVEVLP